MSHTFPSGRNEPGADLMSSLMQGHPGGGNRLGAMQTPNPLLYVTQSDALRWLNQVEHSGSSMPICSRGVSAHVE